MDASWLDRSSKPPLGRPDRAACGTPSLTMLSRAVLFAVLAPLATTLAVIAQCRAVLWRSMLATASRSTVASTVSVFSLSGPVLMSTWVSMPASPSSVVTELTSLAREKLR
jgi:hypothetical protein